MFLLKIKRKKDTKTIIVPGVIMIPKIARNSPIKAFKINRTPSNIWLDEIQYSWGIRKRDLAQEIQLNPMFNIITRDWGSKEEKRFPI